MKALLLVVVLVATALFGNFPHIKKKVPFLLLFHLGTIDWKLKELSLRFERLHVSHCHLESCR